MQQPSTVADRRTQALLDGVGAAMGHDFTPYVGRAARAPTEGEVYTQAAAEDMRRRTGKPPLWVEHNQGGQGMPEQAGAGVEYTHSNILALKDLRKRIRKGVPEERKQRSQLYADVLAVINSYYPNDGAAWRKTAELLPRMGRLESGGSDLAAGAISSALKLMLGNDLTRQNGLMLIQRIAKLSGSLTQDYRPVLRGLSKTLGFPLDLADGSKGMWDLIDVTDAGGIAVRQSTKRKRSDLDQKGGALSRKPPMRQAQIFTPGTEGVMLTQRAIRQRRREQAHRGASAEQQILAGTGVLPPPPGYHYMSTGVLMKDP